MVMDSLRSMLESGNITANSKKIDTMLPTERKEFIDSIIERSQNQRTNSIDQNFDLFKADNILPYPKKAHGILTGEMQLGSLYSIPIKTSAEQMTDIGSKRFEYQLLLNIVRDGQRLDLLIHKLHYIKDNTLVVNIIGSDFDGKSVVLSIDLEEEDFFIVVRGDTFRTVIRQIKKQCQYKKQIQLEHAGSTGSFNENQI